jgi:hypothetical protein
MPLHRQVTIDLDGEAVEVDEGLVPLIEALWERGYRTTGSCENQPDMQKGWIAFEAEGEAESFAELVPGSLRYEVTQEDLDSFIRNGGDPLEAEAFGGVGTPVVAFPPSSIEPALARLKEES